MGRVSKLNFLRDTLTSFGHDSVLIDVGANTGTYSVFASKYAKVVHAFEPYPLILPRLRQLIEENSIGNIVVHPVGLGATELELPFTPPPDDNLGMASFVPGFVQGKGDQIKLRIVPGDTYFPKAGITRVDFIKMDIEGYEKQALAGLQGMLRRYRPVVLMEVSINPALPNLFKSLQELHSAFPNHYDFFEITGRDIGGYRLQDFRPSFDRASQFNIVARPNEKAGKIPVTSNGESALQPTNGRKKTSH